MSRSRRFPFSMSFALAAAFFSLSVLPIEIHAQSDSVIVERDVPAKMRDGVILKADIYRPKADGKYPVLLQRTPYDKNNTRSFGMKAAARGYVVIVQTSAAVSLPRASGIPSATNCRTATTPWN